MSAAKRAAAPAASRPLSDLLADPTFRALPQSDQEALLAAAHGPAATRTVAASAAALARIAFRRGAR